MATMLRFTSLTLLIVSTLCDCTPEAPRTNVVSANEIKNDQQPLIAVDIFDPDPTVVAKIMALHKSALASLQRDHSQIAIDAVINEIRHDNDYVLVKPALVTYYDPQRLYLTIDIVTKGEATIRMPFSPAPTGSHTDPEGLLGAWHRYEAKVFELLDHGEKLTTDHCPVFHCLGNPAHPKLSSLAAPLTAATNHIEELTTILRDDHDVSHRAAAPYLIAYAADGKTVVDALEPSLLDPSPLVRNNSMRVLAEIARNHPEVEIPLAPLIYALTYPTTTDRNKAGATLSQLLSRPSARIWHRRIAHEVGKTLLAMLRLQQPNNHDFAYKILQIISDQPYGDRDIAAWQAWLETQ